MGTSSGAYELNHECDYFSLTKLTHYNFHLSWIQLATLQCRMV